MKIVLIFVKFIGVLLAIIVILITITYANQYLDQKDQFEKSIGHYKYERTTILLNHPDSIFFKNLELTLSSKGDFLFSKKINFINDSSGNWKVGGFGEVNYIELIFRNKKSFQVSVCCTEDKTIEFSYPFITDKYYNNYGNLFFKKLK
jgi:hypothetical protein